MTDKPKVHDLAVIENRLSSIDISKVGEYSKKVADISGLSPAAAAAYMKDFIIAYDVAAAALAVATKCELDAEAALTYQESVAYFDRASAFLESRKVKESDAARKKYVEMDEEVLMATNVYNRAQATAQLMKNKLEMFRYAYEAVKKIYYGGNNNMPYQEI